MQAKSSGDAEREAGERDLSRRKEGETKPVCWMGRPGRFGSRSGRAATALVVLLLLFGAPGHGQQAADGRLLELGAGARGVLSRMQKGWLDWLSAHYQGDDERSRSALDSLLTDAQLLGMESLPDLAASAAASALEAARAGENGRAAKAIAAARRLHPASPVVTYAEARLARIQGQPFRSWVLGAKAFIEELERPTRRFVHLANFAFWAACTLFLLAAGFVALEMTVNGRRLLEDLVRFLGRLLPSPLAWALALVVILWPLLLPAGLFLLLVYWSLLVWGYTSRWEKLLLVFVWVGLAAGSSVVAWVNGRADLMLSPQVRGLERASRGELSGALYLDLQELPAILPESLEVKHLMADLHRELGQLARARPLYLDVLSAEPANEAALVDLGVCYYQEGDLSRAIDYFQRAVEENSAAGAFNLSQAYSELYRFGDSERALGLAQELARPQIPEWIRRSERQGVIALEGGLRRQREIQRQLVAGWIESAGGSAELGRSLLAILPSLLAFSGIAVAVSVLRRRLPKGSLAESGGAVGGRWSDRLMAFLPGRQAAEEGRWIRAWVGLIPAAALLAVPLAGSLNLEQPLRFGDAGQTIGTVFWLLIGLYLATRVWRAVRV